jgi:endonuclease YncB( thermonuclease family)
MERIRVSFTFLCFAVAWIAALFLVVPSTSLSAEPVAATLVRVVDGDTIEILILPPVANENGTTETSPISGTTRMVRLHGIDAPESRQAGGAEATLFVREWMGSVPDLMVEIESVDRYGRLVGEVFPPDSPDALSLNATLLAAGHAWWYREYAPDRTDFARLERTARESRRGLWSDDDPVEPWVWRRRR